MYNFNFMEDEKLVEIFGKVLIKQDMNEKIVTIALTDKRLLFLDYITNDGMDALRITKGVNFLKFKEVFYQLNLEQIEKIENNEYYQIILKNKNIINFNNDRLYELLKINSNI